MTESPYQAPQSNLQASAQASTGRNGSVEAAIAGNYDLEIGAIISEAWEKTNGAKGSIWGATILMCLCILVIGGVFGVLQSIFSKSAVTEIFFQLILTATITPMQIGIFMIGLRRAADQPFSYSSVFQYFGYLVPLILTIIATYAMIFIGFFLLIIPGIYLSVCYLFALLLKVEKQMGIWEAMETSRKTVTKKWFKFLLLIIVFSLIAVVSMIPLGIGLIWTMPMLTIAYGIMYRNVFGVEPIAQ